MPVSYQVLLRRICTRSTDLINSSSSAAFVKAGVWRETIPHRPVVASITTASHVATFTATKRLPTTAVALAPTVGHLTLPSLSQQPPAPAILNRWLLSSSSRALYR
ncbi:hypothetical protein B296_00044526 [Ensete ventricosum]|uniref:Uncharacterized protein n=1 Tax=Ensete ventricosum TaxID=4639 RepID=A0A426XDX0_ENSVE|nr:hypothetical protein B296_00044526 [Ensete ventricosum]